MTENTSPNFSKKCEILGELWLHYRGDEIFKDFIEYNDIGLPLAYMIESEIVQATEYAKQYVNETFELFTEALGLSTTEEDWDSLNHMLDFSRDMGTFPE
jgi:hypothetical protein